ncbi:hypothetical protein BJ944DRAFT_263671 [Cunninghamella echinulata]|nr:hypothetical protein BJ944DRAFT_263671 [Cunninghamella echinulata]
MATLHNVLPQYILSNIISYLPQKSIYECICINKSWHDAAIEQLYESVYFYSEDNILKFYQLLTNVKLSQYSIQTVTGKNFTTSGKLKATLVQHIHIYFQIQSNFSSLLFYLQASCHQIKSITLYDKEEQSINYLQQKNPFSFSHPILPYWRSITHFPSWHGDSMSHWIQELGKQLTHLSLQLTKNDFVDTHELERITPFSFSFLSKKIYITTNNRPQYHHRTFLFQQQHEYEQENSGPYNIMQLIFPSHTFLQLKVLQLDLGSISTSVPSNFKKWQYPVFSQSTFDQIHTSCPLLDTLVIKNLNMHLWYHKDNKTNCKNNNSNHDPLNNTPASLLTNVQKTEACTTLKTLQLDNVIFYHPLCLIYLSLKYSYLRTLKLNIHGYEYIKEEEEKGDSQYEKIGIMEDYKKALYLFMTQSPFIATIHIQFIINKFGSQWKQTLKDTIMKYWPNNEMMAWLEAYPKRLKDIHFPCIDIYEVDHKQPSYTYITALSKLSLQSANSAILSHRLYLNYLTALTLTFIHETPESLLYNYFKSNRHSSQNDYLQHLRSLKIVNCDKSNYYVEPLSPTSPSTGAGFYRFSGDGNLYQQQDQGRLKFYIYHWLDTIPQLKRLDIQGMVIEDGFIAHHLHTNNFSTIITHNNNNKETYQLEELIITYSHIKLASNLNGLFQKCPRLTKFHCKNINYQLISPPYLESNIPDKQTSLLIAKLTTSFINDSQQYNYPIFSASPLKVIATNHYFDDIQMMNVSIIDELQNNLETKNVYKLNHVIVLKYKDIQKHYQHYFNTHPKALFIVCEAYNRVRVNDYWCQY